MGKSALTVRFVKDAFLEHYNPTIEGASLVVRRIVALAVLTVPAEHFRREINVNGETIGVSVASCPPSTRVVAHSGHPLVGHLGHRRGRAIYRPQRGLSFGAYSLRSRAVRCCADRDYSSLARVMCSSSGDFARDLIRAAAELRTHSLTQEASLQELEGLRQQILHVKAGEPVRFSSILAFRCLIAHSERPLGYRWHEDGSRESFLPLDILQSLKCRQYNEREVTRAAIQDLASRWNVPFYETSAKKNWHIQEVFSDLAKQMIVRYPNASPKKRHRKDCVIM